MADKPLWGDGAIEFGRWETPFENDTVWLVELTWGGGTSWSDEERPQWTNRSLHKSPYDAVLVVLVTVHPPDQIRSDPAHDPLYRVSFDSVRAFRVLDEGGLPDFGYPDAQGRLPPGTTFRVRNHTWSKESLLAFLWADDGWSYAITTGGDCIEVVAADPPVITLEA